MKECSVCKTSETPQWYTGPVCKACYRKKHRQDNKKKYKEVDRANYEANREGIIARQKEYYKNNVEECKKRSSEHRNIVGDQRNLDNLNKWKNANKERRWQYFKYANAKRRAKKLNATPPWLTKEHLEQIKEIYKNCPKGYQVDHIIPLQGKEVSGLHVPWNLQHLTALENRKKHNKI